jgi:nitrogen fixation protein FixH
MQHSTNNSGARWKLGIVALIGVFLVGMAASLTVAARRVSRVVDPDYYSHGLHYGQTQDRGKNAGLGWTIAAEVSGDQLQVRIKDASGTPVSGGRLSFELNAGGSGKPAAALEFAEAAPGLFRARRPAPEGGELHGTLRYARGEALASQKLVLLN